MSWKLIALAAWIIGPLVGWVACALIAGGGTEESPPHSEVPGAGRSGSVPGPSAMDYRRTGC